MNRSFWRHYCRNRGAVAGLALMLLIVALAVVAPWLFPRSPWAMVQRPMLEPFAAKGLWLGTDTLGRDVASGIAHGARVSLMVGGVSTLVALLIGVTLGAVAGYLRGITDDLAMRFTELFQSIPNFALAIVMVAVLQPTITTIVLVIGIVSWPPVARLVRAEFLSLRSREFVEAAEISGQSNLRIIVMQILPNALSPIIVMGSMMVASAILLESALSFLGLRDPNVMSWGYMIGAARTVIRQAWWLSLFPGVAIFLTVLALNLVGEGLRDALDPRMTPYTA